MVGKLVRLLSLLILTAFFANSASFAANIKYPFKKEFKNISFEWKVEKDSLFVRLSAKTKGWVGVGFNPTKGMKDANFVIGYVKRGKAYVSDQYGIRIIEHLEDEKNGGKTNVSNVSGSERRGKTTISFSIPLDSGDTNDVKLDPNGKTTVLLAFGPSRDSFSSRHKFRTRFYVNLSTGESL